MSQISGEKLVKFIYLHKIRRELEGNAFKFNEEYIMVRTTAVILSGGQGSRLGPLTLKRAKPAVSFGGKNRLIDLVTNNCAKSDIGSLFILSQYLHRSLKNHLNNGLDFGYISNFNVLSPQSSQESEQVEGFEGTADAVRKIRNEISNYHPEAILVLSGDHIYNENYSNAIKQHIELNTDVTLYVKPVERKFVKEFGIVKLNDNGRIYEFVEKTKDPKVIKELAIPEQLKTSLVKDKGLELGEKEDYPASLGIYIFKPEVLFKLLDQQGVDFGKHLLPNNISKLDVHAYFFNKYWKDVGQLEQFYEAHMDLLDHPEYEILNGVHTHARDLNSSLCIGELIGSIISEGCVIEKGAKVKNSTLGYKVMVRNNAAVSDSLILGSDRNLIDNNGEVLQKYFTEIGEGSKINKVIFDKNIIVGKDVSIGMDGIPLEERIKRLNKIDGFSYYDIEKKKPGFYTITDSGILVVGKPDDDMKTPHIPDGFVC